MDAIGLPGTDRRIVAVAGARSRIPAVGSVCRRGGTGVDCEAMSARFLLPDLSVKHTRTVLAAGDRSSAEGEARHSEAARRGSSGPDSTTFLEQS